MRVNLSAIRRGELELASVAATVAPGELDVLTNGLIDRQLTLLLGAVDA
nr:hypothetical protein [Chloroflexia bacterium]